MTTGPVTFNLTTEEATQLRTLRTSLADFRAMLATLDDAQRSVEHNQQFNQFRAEALALLKSNFSEEVPKAITGDVTTDRSLSLIVVGGVLLALVGFGINAIILEDTIINSLGCCVSGGGTLLVIGAFVVLAMKNYRERVNNVAQLRERCDLLLLQIDHKLKMGTMPQ